MKKHLSIAIFLHPFLFSIMNAQDTTSQNNISPQTVNSPAWGTRKTVIAGGASATYVHDSSQSNFRDAMFHLMALSQITSKLFLISEVEIETMDGMADFGLEQAQVCYKLTPSMTLYGGRFLPKFGRYRGNFGEAFINRLATKPVGFGDGGVGPMVETGVGAVGGFQVGYSKLNYDFYVSNGPQLLTGSADDPASAGQFEYESFLGNNKNKAVGGRIGLLPFPNSSLELGVSALKKWKTGDMGTPFEKVNATWYAADINFFQTIEPIKSMLRVMGEYKGAMVGKADYPVQGDTTGATYTFNNNATAYYAQATLRPVKLNNRVISKIEMVARYSEFTTPKDALWGGNKITQAAFGINYWLNWDCVFKLTYQKQNNAAEIYLAQIAVRF